MMPIYTSPELCLLNFFWYGHCSRRAALTGTAPTMALSGAYLFDGVK